MSKARTVGPIMMIVVGLALFASPARSAIEVGTVGTGSTSTSTIFDPCFDDVLTIGFGQPCTPVTRPEITTTTADVTTTTTAVTTTTGSVTTTTGGTGTSTTAPAPTTAAPTTSTTAPGGVAGSGGNRPPTASQGGALARTGSSSAPLTAGGVALAGLGVVLLVAERRRAAARA